MQNIGEIYLGIQSFKMATMEKYLHLGKEFRFFSGETIRKPLYDSFILYIKQGCFCLNVTNQKGIASDLAYCREGSVMQINSMLVDNELWDPASMTALQNSIVVTFTRDEFYELICQDRLLFDEYVNNASTYSSLLKQRLLITANLNSSQRLLNWLYKLSQCHTPTANNVYIIDCDLTQQQIADLLFIHVTTCNKIFSKLNKANIAKHSRGKIMIYRLDMLEKYIEEEWKLT